MNICCLPYPIICYVDNLFMITMMTMVMMTMLMVMRMMMVAMVMMMVMTIHLVMKLCLQDMRMFFSLKTCSCCCVSTMCCKGYFK